MIIDKIDNAGTLWESCAKFIITKALYTTTNYKKELKWLLGQIL